MLVSNNLAVYDVNILHFQRLISHFKLFFFETPPILNSCSLRKLKEIHKKRWSPILGCSTEEEECSRGDGLPEGKGNRLVAFPITGSCGSWRWKHI